VEEEGTEQLGDGESPHTVTHVFEHILLEEGSEDGRSLGRTRWTEAPASTREGQEILALASIAVDASEASIQITTVAEGVDDTVDEAPPTAVLGREAFFPGPLDVLVAGLDEAVEGRGLRSSRPIDGWAKRRQGRAPPLPCERRKPARSSGSCSATISSVHRVASDSVAIALPLAILAVVRFLVVVERDPAERK
jgi:hypothetical protein